MAASSWKGTAVTLTARTVSHTFGSVRALRDVSLTAARGRVTAVIGPNASGKTTLMRALCGALRPNRGEVLLDDRALRTYPPEQRAAAIAYVPQRPQVAAAFSVRDVVELGRWRLPRDVGRVDAALASLGLQSLADRPYAALSVGQQQRVVVARALAQVNEQGFLILDEPAAAMDVRHTIELVALLRQCARGGSGVVMTVHDIALAAAVADDVAILSDGSLIAAGPVGEVLRPETLKQVFDADFDRVGAGLVPRYSQPESR